MKKTDITEDLKVVFESNREKKYLSCQVEG